MQHNTIQFNSTDIPTKWSQQYPALRNNKSVGKAGAVVEDYYATNLPHVLLTPRRRRVLTAKTTLTIDVLMILFLVSRFINRVNV